MKVLASLLFCIAPDVLRKMRGALRFFIAALFPVHRLRSTVYRLGIIAVLTLALLGGCGGERPAETAGGRIPVRVFLLLISTKQVEYYAWAEQAFEAAHPDVDIIIEQFPGTSLKDFEIKLRLRFSSGQAPDVIHLHENVGSELARLGLLEKAPGYIEEMVEENSLNEMIRQAPYIDGTLYGIVSDGVWTALYYNKDLFREAGLDPDDPPETWDELVDYADRLTERAPDGTLRRTGLSLRKTGYKPGTAEKWFTFLYSAGGRPFNEEGTAAVFDSEAGEEALELYREVLFEKNIDDVTFEGDQQGFGQERVAMFIREIHVIRWLRENYPDLDFGVAPIPAEEASISQGATYWFVVSDDAPHPEAAWRFIAFLMSDEAYARYASIGGVLPVTKSVAALPEYSEDPYIKVFLEQDVASSGGFPRAGRAADMIGAYIERFAYGRLGLEETLERAERDVNALLERNR